MIPSSITEIIGQLSDAITASGQTLPNIGKEPILQYLKKVGAPKQYWNDIYERLKDIHDPGSRATSGAPRPQQTLPQEKHREPRKSVFGPVKKIAG